MVHGDSQGLLNNAGVFSTRPFHVEGCKELADMFVSGMFRLCGDFVDALVHGDLVAPGVSGDIHLQRNISNVIIGFSSRKRRHG